jgi:hypothetical protein
MAISGRRYTNRPVIVTGHIGGQDVLPSAIASEEAFGTAVLVVDQLISPSAIASAEAFGSHAVFPDQFITVTGIASAEAVGNPSISNLINTTGIASAEDFGFPTITMGSRWVLRPPSVQETPMANNILHKRFGIHRGISILKRANGTYYSTRYPALTEVEEALATYMGGYVYTISSTVRDELVSAGFGSYITLEDV